MRRFYGYLALIVSLILVVFCNIQTQVQNVKSGIEYSGGYEILYKVDFKESKKDVDEISKLVVSRLEDANVQSANVKSEKGDENDYVRIQMSGNSETEIDYALRSVESTGKLTVSTLMDGANFAELENPFVIGSASVNWNKSTPYVEVSVQNPKEFIDFVDNCKSDYKAFNEKYNKDNKDDSSSVEGVMVIWLDKQADDSYIEAYENDNEVIKTKIRSRVLAIVPTNNFNYTTNANGEYEDAKLLISYYDFSQTQLVAESAHTVERIINYGSEDYSLTRLYTQRIDSTATNVSIYDQLILWGLVVASVVVLVFLVIRYGLAGLTGWVAISTSMFAQIAFFNYFDYSLSTIAAISFVVSFVINAAAVIVYLSKFKNELYKGKTPLKSSQEANKKTFGNLIDVSILGLVLAIVGILAFSSQIKELPIIILIGVAGNLILTRLIMLFAMWWLTNNSLANKNLKLFAVNKNDVPDIMKMEQQRKFAPLANVDVTKNSKRNAIAAGSVSLVCVLLIAIFAIIPGVKVFNDSTESRHYSRLEITSELVNSDYLWQNSQDADEFFKKNYPNLVVTGIDSNVVQNVVSETASENLVDVVYVSVQFDGLIDHELHDSILNKIKEENHVDAETVSLSIVDCAAESVDYLFNAALIATILFGALSIVFILVRFGLNYSLASLATLVPTTLVSLGFYSATRLPISSISLAGIAGGLLIVVLAQLPLYERIKQLIHESKTKVVTYEDKEAISKKAFSETIFTSLMIFGVALATIIVVSLFSPLTSSVLSTYGTMAIAVVIGGVSTFLILLPIYLFLEKNLKFSFYARRRERAADRNKKAMKKAQEVNKKHGAEPEESKIPGINC